MDIKHGATCGRMISPGRQECDFCAPGAESRLKPQHRRRDPGPDIPPPGFGWILFLTFWPAAWSTLKILIGLFQAVTGVTFAEFHDWYENRPVWAILLLTPILVVVMALLVICLLVGTLALCGLVFRLATR